MKQILLIIAVLSAACATFVGCSKNETKESPEQQFKKALTADDTTIVLTKTKQCLDLLKAGNIDEAFADIYFIDDKKCEVVALPDSIYERLVAKYKKFPVVDYRLESLYFAKYDSSEVRYSFEFVPEHPEMTMSMAFLPVKLGNEWFITIKGTGSR